MSAGVPGAPGEELVRNSALTVAALAQAVPVGEGSSQNPGDQTSQADRLMPAGLKALCDACSRLYPDQPNPLQVTTRLKYWLGGNDPLDYISMYWNPGIPAEQVPPHWHYVSFGLSDLHGDGRVHACSGSAGGPSGHGAELTLRLVAEAGAPPLWPAALLQALARYVFTTGNRFCVGDHISWHAPLDARGGRVRHLLVAADAALPRVHTPHGTVDFIQLVGCTSRELRAAQRTSGFEVLKAMQDDPSCGGRCLVTLPTRRRSARVPPAAQQPAHLAGVSCRLRFTARPSEDQPGSPCLSPRVEREIKETLQRGLSSMSTDRPTEVIGHMSTDSFEMSSIEKALPQLPELVQSSWREDAIEYLDEVHLFLNAEGASLLPLAIDGRVLHDRHFTWRDGPRAVTVLSPAVEDALVTSDKPYARRGGWLQILIPREQALRLSKLAAPLSRLGASSSSSGSETEGEAPAPRSIAIDKLKISIVNDEDLL